MFQIEMESLKALITDALQGAVVRGSKQNKERTRIPKEVSLTRIMNMLEEYGNEDKADNEGRELDFDTTTQEESKDRGDCNSTKKSDSEEGEESEATKKTDLEAEDPPHR